MAIRNRTAIQQERSRLALLIEPYKQWGLLVAGMVGLVIAAYGLARFLIETAPAVGDRIRGEGIITAQYQEVRALPPPATKGLLPTPSNMTPVGEAAGKLIELRTQSGDLLLDSRDFIYLASRLYASVPFSEGRLGRIVPRFREVQDEFIRRGWAAWRNPDEPRQGVVLTEMGQDYVFREVLGHVRPPSPVRGLDDNGPGTHVYARTHDLQPEGEGG
jgi:hypothetical protein